MISLGFITMYPNQEKLYATEIATRAFDHGIQLYRFTPTSIEPTTEMVRGEIFNNDTKEWDAAVFEIPSYLYDRCFYSFDGVSKKSQPIMNWLKMRPSCHFLGQGLPNKWDIYEVLIQDKVLAPYIPPTEQAVSPTAILHSLMKAHQIILKPEKGSMGKGIISLSLHRNYAEAVYKDNQQLEAKQFTTRAELKKWIEGILSSQPYLIQKYLPLQDENNCPFDIRILLQKNQLGEWVEQGRGIRRGLPDHIISNLGGGGEILSFDEWSDNMATAEKLLLFDNIHTITTRLPFVLEENFSPLFELGVDVGLSKDGALWLLDSNSKPGRKVILETSPDKHDKLYTAPLHYCLYLHSQQSIRS
ncbi:YheC/YheD family protein [Fredinandcohnia humi]